MNCYSNWCMYLVVFMSVRLFYRTGVCICKLLVPVLKQGDLCLHDNWRGISLVGKVFVKVIQKYLQSVVEDCYDNINNNNVHA